MSYRFFPPAGKEYIVLFGGPPTSPVCHTVVLCPKLDCTVVSIVCILGYEYNRKGPFKLFFSDDKFQVCD